MCAQNLVLRKWTIKYTRYKEHRRIQFSNFEMRRGKTHYFCQDFLCAIRAKQSIY